MRFADFERAARAVWQRIPSQYRSGVDGLIVDRGAMPHPADPDVYTLGECVTEEYPSEYGGPDTIRSAVVLYYGSFRQVAAADDAFEWHDEIHETIMHELQHHLESLATEAGLEDFDYAVGENFKRLRGERFDPLFYRAGDELAIGTVTTESGGDLTNDGHDGSARGFAVESDRFLEVITRGRGAVTVAWEWENARYRAVLPESDADITFHCMEEPPLETGDFCIVRVIRRGALATLRSALSGGQKVAEVTIATERVS